MRCLWGGVALVALIHQAPAMADCAAEIATLEGELASSQESRGAADVQRETDKAADQEDRQKSPEQVVDEMVEEGSVVIEDETGAETKFSGTGQATPGENWFGSPPEDHPVAGALIDAKRLLGEDNEQACLDKVREAREAMKAMDSEAPR